MLETNGIVSGVGGGSPHYWNIRTNGSIVSACGISNGVCVTFNLESEVDIRSKVMMIEGLVKDGRCSEAELLELKEILRLENSLVAGGTGERTTVGIGEAVKTVYTDGKPIKVEKRKKIIATPAQKKAAENARRYAHTPEAEKKRRKSINARKDAKILGEI